MHERERGREGEGEGGSERYFSYMKGTEETVVCPKFLPCAANGARVFPLPIINGM